jgi:hypothetical protein
MNAASVMTEPTTLKNNAEAADPHPRKIARARK